MPDDKQSEAYFYLGLIPVLLSVALTSVLHLLFYGHPFTRTVFEPPFLLFVLHGIFLCLTSFVVAYIAMRSYLLGGSATVLFLGCGLLTLGTGAFFASWLIGSAGPNVNVTVFNLSVLVMAIFHTSGTVLTVMERPREADLAPRRRKLAAGCAFVLVFVPLMSLAAARNVLPPFFIQGSGPTSLRQTVVFIALLLFVVSSSAMMIRLMQERSRFFYWYSLGLALHALGIGAAFLQPAVGSPIGWTGRAAEWAAGIYFLLAVLAASHEARAQGMSVKEKISDLFGRSERKIAAILDSIIECHCEADKDWRLIGVNERALAHFGKKREELLGGCVWDVLPRLRGSAFEDRARAVMLARQPAHFEMASLFNRGSWLEIHAYPTEEGAAVYFRDVTQRRRAEEELKKAHAALEEHARKLQEANRELEGFAYSVSHDLRTPLRAIDGFVGMLERDHGDTLDGEVRRKFDVVRENARKMGQLIDGLLRFSRLGRTSLRPTTIDMTALAREAAREIAAAGPEGSVEVRIDELPPAYGDPVLIKQVFANLIDNAVKFSRGRDAPAVRAGAFEQDGEHVYYLKDNGAGFDMRYYEKLFGVFQRLHSESRFPGTGVGLAIVQRIILRHDGRVWAEGAVDRGATFYFALPKRSADERRRPDQ